MTSQKNKITAGVNSTNWCFPTFNDYSILSCNSKSHSNKFSYSFCNQISEKEQYRYKGMKQR